MREYIIAIDEKDVTMCFLNGMRNAELIRCKDCKYAHLIEPGDDWWECEHDKRVLHSYGFCSWAERKEE